MPTGALSYITDANGNVGTVAPRGNVTVGETFPFILASYHQSISAASGGTNLPNIPCGKIEIQNLSGNHVMWWGGVGPNAPYSGRGNEIPPMDNGNKVQNPLAEKILYINNANQISICSSFSGEMVAYVCYGNGQQVIIDPNTQGSQPNNNVPTVVSFTPVSGFGSGMGFQSGVGLNSGNSITVTFSQAMASGSVLGFSGIYMVNSGSTSPHISGTYSMDNTGTIVTFTPFSGTLRAARWMNVIVDAGTMAANGLTVGSNVTGNPFQTELNPVASGESPISGATDRPFNSIITWIFSEPLDQTTVNEGTLTVSLSGQFSPILSGSVSYTPGSTVATLTVNSGQYQLSGWYQPFAVSLISTPTGAPLAFTTSGSPFQIQGPPIVSGFSPVSGTNTVSGLQIFTVIFSENMGSSTINTSGIYMVISGQSNPTTTGHISGTVGLNLSDATKGTFSPNSGQLVTSTWYNLIANTNCQDAFGNSLGATVTGAFETASVFGNDTTAPQISGTSPVSGATGVNTSGVINATFSKLVQSGTVITSTTQLHNIQAGDSNVASTVSLQSDLITVVITPNASLSTSSLHRIELSGVKDLAGNLMTPFSGATFTTEAAPQVSGTSPVSGATNVATNGNLTITMSKSVQSGTVTQNNGAGSVTVVDIQGVFTPIAATVSLQSNLTTIVFKPTSSLQVSDLHRFEVSGIKDLDGNFMTPFSGATFTTEAAPAVSSTTPVSGATGVDVTANILGTMSKACLSASINTTTFVVTAVPSAGAVAASVSLQTNNTSITFNPNAALSYSTTYSINISGIKDLDSNFMNGVSGIFFTTQAPPLTQVYSVGSANSNVSMGAAQTYLRLGEVANNSSSALIGDNIKQAQFTLQRVGSSFVSGDLVYFTVRDSNDVLKTTLGSTHASSLSTAWNPVTLTNANANFAMGNGSAIFAEFSGGDSSNYVNIMKNGSAPFDGSNSICRTYQRNGGLGTQPGTDITGVFWD